MVISATRKTMAWCIVCIAACSVLFACESNRPGDERTRLVVWGTAEGEAKIGYDSLITRFEAKYPDIVVVRAIPERGGDLQKLLTAHVGGDPPDLIQRESRFLGNLAARGILRPLDDLIERDLDKPDGIRPDEYYPGCWDEMVYNGQTWGIPGYTSPNVFAYNKKAFREVGLDPERPPRTWDELRDYAERLVKFDENGDLERVGFMPGFRGMDPIEFYARQLGGNLLDSTGRNARFDDPAVKTALEFTNELYRTQGGRRAVQAFAMATAQTENVEAFQLGNIAMALDDDFVVYRTARYGNPDRLELGLATAPQPNDTSTIVMYQRGTIWSIPTRAKHVEAAWKFLKFVQSMEGYEAFRSAIANFDMHHKGMQYAGLHARRPLNDIFDEYLPPQEELRNEALKVPAMMEYVWSPRPTAVASFLWDRQMELFDNVTYGTMPIDRAIRSAQANAQRELDRYYSPPRGTLVNWTNVTLALGVLSIFSIGVVWWFARKRSGAGVRSREFWIGIAFLSPWLIGFLVFTAGPIIYSIVISFTEFEAITPARWVGFENYTFLLTQDPVFWKSLWNTVFMTIGIPIGMAVGLGIALLLNSNVKGLSAYRTIYYLPAIVPVVASSILWIYVLHPKLGILNLALHESGLTTVIVWLIGKWNVVLRWFGFDPIDSQFWLWIQSEDWAKPGIVLMGLWGAGASMIIWLAGLKGIPQHLYEAAEIDGAGVLKRFTHVTLPMLTPYIFFNLVTGVIGTFQVFTQAFVMTLGGPAQSTLFYVYYLFNNAFSYFKMGYASAMAWLLFLIVFVLTMVQLWGAKRWVHYE